jgi:xylulokinase
VGNGIVNRGTLSTSIGTSGIMFVHCDDVQIDPAGRVHTFCHAVRGKWHIMGVSLSGGGSLEWFRNRLCKAEAALARRAKQSLFELLTQEAAEVPCGSEGLFFLPYLSGERTPHADPDARGCFIGLTLAHGRGHLVRSIMEGVVYAMRDSLAIIKELGVPVKQIQIRASGGGSQSALWRQIQADAFGQSVVTLNAEQGPAYGVALLAAVGAGEYKNVEEACAATIRVVDTTPAGAAAKKTYDRGFPVFQQLYRSLKDDFKRIAAL